MVRPIASRRRNSSQLPHSGTRLELAISTRGAHSCVRNTPTGRPDWTSIVSSSASVSSVATRARNDGQSRAAFPVPPYTTRSSGRSATSGSRLFMSIRLAASCGHPCAVRVPPRGARIVTDDLLLCEHLTAGGEPFERLQPPLHLVAEDVAHRL